MIRRLSLVLGIPLLLLSWPGFAGGQDDGVEPSWIRFDVGVGGGDALVLSCRHRGWAGRRIQVSLSREARGGRRTTGELEVEERGGSVLLGFPRGSGPLVCRARDPRSGRLLLEAPVEVDHDWLVTGPFPVEGAGYGVELPPETAEVDPRDGWEVEGAEVGWKPFDASVLEHDGYADLDEVLGPRSHAVGYVATRWRFEEPTDVVLRMGSDDILEVFQDGERIHEHSRPRPSSPDQDRVETSFEPGVHTLLIKVGELAGGWGFHLRVETAEGEPLEPETVPFRRPSWRPGGPPRVVDVSPERVVVEVGSAAPVPVALEAAPAIEGGPDPRRFREEGLGMLRPEDAEPRTVAHGPVHRTRHRLEIEGLARGTRFVLRGVAGDAGPRGPGEDGGPTDWRAVRTPSADGRTAVLRLRLAAVFFADVVERGRGEDRRVPRARILERIEEIRSAFAETVRTWFVHSGCRLHLSIETFEDWEPHVVRPDTSYGYAYGGEEWDAVERVLAEEGRSPADFDGYVLVSFDRRWDEEADGWTFPFGGGGTLGPIRPFFATKSGWKSGGDAAWLLCHEYQHALDATWKRSGYPEFLHNHFDPRRGTAHAHGYHWDGNFWTLRWWGGHARRDDQTRWHPGDRRWRWLLCGWGRYLDRPDRDDDGIPDRAPDLPLDEARFGSSPDEVDSDGDGLPDLGELMESEWLVDGHHEIRAGRLPDLLEPTDPDTDGDGRSDGEDPHPLLAIPDDLAEPVEIAVEDPIHGRIVCRVAWRDGDLSVGVRTEEGAPRRITLRVDADADGWFVGGDNLMLRANEEGLRTRNLHQCARPGRGPHTVRDGVPAPAVEADREDDALVIRLRPVPELGFAGEPGETIGLAVTCRPPGAEVDRRRSPETLSIREPHTFLRLVLPAEDGDPGE